MPATQPMPAADAVIDIRGLSFYWQPQAPVVLALDPLCVEKGEWAFIEGPSGSGKSTLLSLLAGVTVPQRGELHVLGQQLDRLRSVQRDHFRAHHIGYIFQMFNLIPYLSMVDNVVLPCRFSKARHDKALQRSGSLEAEAVRLLEHLDVAHTELLHRPVTALSVGQQQRVAAAPALMGAPELLIADEPTSSLDTDRREAFVSLLFRECAQAGSTLVFVSHDATLERLFDRTIRLAEVNTAGTRPAREG
jgi:putative ABC transport system ATP-binding protein